MKIPRLNRFLLSGAFSLVCGLAIGQFPTVAPLPVAPVVSAQEQTVLSAAAVLNEAMSAPGNRIPEAMLSDCYGVAIVPNVIKGSFIVGARRGKGVLFVKDPGGLWHAPVFVTLTGGNIGWQVGVQSSDIVLVFKTQRSVQGILSGKLTIGGDASAAAGPVGRGTAVATDGQLRAEIYTYSRSRGLFAGVAIDGTAVQIDELSTGSYYQNPAPNQPAVIPPTALQLTQQIAAYAGHQPPAKVPDLAGKYGASQRDLLRDQMWELAPALFELLDPQWQNYLALPAIPTDGSSPSPEAIAQALQHYDSVAADPRFQTLAVRPEFRSIHGLLKHYQHTFTPTTNTLQLPPPPPTP